MIRNSIRALCATHFIVAVTLCLFLTTESTALQLTIIESGPESNTTVGVWVRGLDSRSLFDGVSRLVSPSGEVFDSSTILEDGLFSDLLHRFDSVAEATDYVTGTWQASLIPRFIPPTLPPLPDTLEFSIDGTSLASINRTPPVLVSPTPGAIIKNGSTFLFGWDYLGSGEVPHHSIFQTIPHRESGSGGSQSSVNTPAPGETFRSSGTIGSGDDRLSESLTNIPGVFENRFLYTLESAEAALPRDVEITLGSYVSLNDSVSLGDTSGVGSIFLPRIDLAYSRQIDPFTITLSTVPEPSSVALVVVMVIGCALSRLWSAGR